MFLAVTAERNEPLVRFAAQAHEAGLIPPDTYVIDRDTVGQNAAFLARAADAAGLTAWFVVKQIGRNPLLIETIAEQLPAAAAIDVREADTLADAGARLGNVGHLVQIPWRQLPRILALEPEAVTVFDIDNMRAVSAAAVSLGRVQKVLLRVESAPTATYPGQEGGFSLRAVAPACHEASELPGVELAGVTGFPCLLYSDEAGRTMPTDTLARVLEAADLLCAQGIQRPIVDLPSSSSTATMPELARLGATHAEPGHALTGTTPQHARDVDLLERPAMVYVTEVAQHDGSGRPIVFGGGFYARGHCRHALVGAPAAGVVAEVLDLPAESIDYYRTLVMPDATVATPIGTTVLMAFRAQIFVTRSLVAIVSGLSEDRPIVDGFFDALGHPVWPTGVARVGS